MVGTRHPRGAPLRRGAAAPALLVCGLALAQCGGPAPQGGAGVPAPAAVATVDQVMEAIVIPSSQKVFDAVVYSNGEPTSAPRTDSEWLDVQLNALAVAEAANLLMLPPRAADDGAWMTMSAALRDSAALAARAAGAKDVDGVLKAGSEMYGACTACHAQYIPGAQP